MLSLLEVEKGGSRKFIVKKGGDMSFCSRDLLAACLCTTSPGLESDGREGWHGRAARRTGNLDCVPTLSFWFPHAPESRNRRDIEILAPSPFKDYTEAGSEEMHRDSGGLQPRVQKRTRLNLRGPYGTKGAS